MPSFLKRIASNQKQLFLIDGIGASISAFFLGVLLVQLRSLIGMPENILYNLAVVPCFFALYSFGCYFFLKSNWAKYLRIIAICNLLYCIATVWLVYFYVEILTYLGLLYFIVELVIIFMLVRLELRSTAAKKI